jgi:DNA-binding response OmpR family regulator
MTLFPVTFPGILIISTDEAAARPLKDAFREWRYSVETIGDASQALKLLTGQNPPSIALIDSLPSLNGVELAGEVRRRVLKAAQKARRG